MRAIDVHAHSGEAVRETLSYEALGSEMVALVEIVPADDMKNAGVALETARMELELVLQVSDPAEAPLGLLERHTPNDSVHFISEID